MGKKKFVEFVNKNKGGKSEAEQIKTPRRVAERYCAKCGTWVIKNYVDKGCKCRKTYVNAPLIVGDAPEHFNMVMGGYVTGGRREIKNFIRDKK